MHFDKMGSRAGLHAVCIGRRFACVASTVDGSSSSSTYWKLKRASVATQQMRNDVCGMMRSITWTNSGYILVGRMRWLCICSCCTCNVQITIIFKKCRSWKKTLPVNRRAWFKLPIYKTPAASLINILQLTDFPELVFAVAATLHTMIKVTVLEKSRLVYLLFSLQCLVEIQKSCQIWSNGKMEVCVQKCYCSNWRKQTLWMCSISDQCSNVSIDHMFS